MSETSNEQTKEDLTGIRAQLVMYETIRKMIALEMRILKKVNPSDQSKKSNQSPEGVEGTRKLLSEAKDKLKPSVSTLEEKVGNIKLSEKEGDTILKRANAGSNYISKYGYKLYCTITMRYLLINAFVDFELNAEGTSEEDRKNLSFVKEHITKLLSNDPKYKEIEEKYSGEFRKVAERSHKMAMTLENYR